jgi:hypothetical protein
MSILSRMFKRKPTPTPEATPAKGLHVASIPGQVLLYRGDAVIRITPTLARELAGCLERFAAKADELQKLAVQE